MEERGEAEPKIRQPRTERLRIDQVLSTQPELGPSIPDGGYGWVILVATAFFQLAIPSISISYGIFLMFDTLEKYQTDAYKFWDNEMINTPLFFIILWTVMDPICRMIIATSRWPRLVGLCSTCLVCIGILIFWIGINQMHWYQSIVYKISGIFSGIGVALILTQCEVLISQYFRLKLFAVNLILRLAALIGFILNPVLLGEKISRMGLSHVVIWYHLYILTGAIICILFKKPHYLKSQARIYNVVSNRHQDDDEEDIFSKNVTELKARSVPDQVRSVSDHDRSDQDRSVFDQGRSVSDQGRSVSDQDTSVPGQGRSVSGQGRSVSGQGRSVSGQGRSVSDQGPSHAVEIETKVDTSHWEKFDEDDDDDDDGEMAPPKELFTELQVNNNNTYSFDNTEIAHATDTSRIFTVQTQTAKDRNDFAFCKTPAFYKSLLLQIALKYSNFVFFTILPSYFYFHMQYLHAHSVTAILGFVFVGCLLAIAIFWIGFSERNRTGFIAIFSLLASIGFFLIYALDSESGIIIGAVLAIFAIYVLHYVSEPLLTLHVKSEPNRMYVFLNLITGFSFLFFFVTNLTYKHCFLLIAILQLANTSVFFCNYVYKKICSFR